MTVNEAFESFKSRLELTDKSQDAAARAQQAVRTAVAKHLDVTTSLLTGSYSRYTKIEPLSDIDVFFVRNSARVGLVTDGSGISAHAAISELETAVKKAYPGATTKAQSRSVNLALPNLTFGFDLIPAWYRSPNGFWIPDSDQRSWLPTDPNGHADLMTSANDESNGMLKPLVKMTKHWSRNNLDLLRSFHLELICKNIVASHGVSSWSHGMATIIVSLSAYVGRTMMDPIYGESRVDKPLTPDEHEKLIGRVTYDGRNAIEAYTLENAGRTQEAIEKWRHVFMSGF